MKENGKKNNYVSLFRRNEHKFISNKNAKSSRRSWHGRDIFAVSASEADTNLENKEVNVLLLGPQVRFMKGQFEQKLQPKGIPLDVINMADYGMMNGEKVLDQAISLMGSSN